MSKTLQSSVLMLVLLTAAQALAVVPYTPSPLAGGEPIVGPSMLAPDGVYGKEYSHDLDFSVVGPVSDPQQVIAWDGIGGTADSLDYSGTRLGWEVDQEVDAIANSRDALYDHGLRDEAHLIFSHDDLITAYGLSGGGFGLVPVPSGGPIPISNGNMIGGAGEVTVEESGAFGPPSSQFTWASLPEVNAMPEPVDVDGLEVWGREPRKIEEPDAPVIGDADKYSLDVDFPSGVSVWNASGSPYIGWPTIVSSVESLLGPVPPTAFSLRDEHQGRQAINLDALLVSDVIEDVDFFHEDVGEPGVESLVDQNGFPFDPFGVEGEPRGDSIVFSIRQIVDPEDGDGYYATGSELFVLDSLGGVSFLEHGGHAWDHEYSLSELALVETDLFKFGVIDINGIELIGADVLEPKLPLPGDFNDDGKVSPADYTLWRDNLGTSFPLAGNGEESGTSAGIVDKDDYLLWRSNYGAMAASGSSLSATSSAIPEPSSLLLLSLAVACCGFRCRSVSYFAG